MSLDWLKHAFAIEPASAFEPTEVQRELVDRVCRQIIVRELTTPAMLFLETVRPLNYVTGQTLQFFTPLLSAVGGATAAEQFATFLEHRGSIDYLCRRVEELSREEPAAPPKEPEEKR
jgi:hypothetical protein